MWRMSAHQGQVNLSRYAPACTTTRVRTCPTTGAKWNCAGAPMGKHTRSQCNGTASISGARRLANRRSGTSPIGCAPPTRQAIEAALRPRAQEFSAGVVSRTAYSPECVEGEFSEVELLISRFLGSSPPEIENIFVI